MTANSREPSIVSIEEMDKFFHTVFPMRPERQPRTVLAEKGRVIIEMTPGKNALRPGGFISGPTQMMLTDHAAYVAVFTHYGITPMALTTNLDYNFLRPCLGETLVAEATIIKPGRNLVVIEVKVSTAENPKLAGFATVTYALPEKT